MHVEEIIKNYNPVYPTGGTWQDAFKVMQESANDFNVVKQLVSELEKYGEFREPIVLSTYEEYVKDWADYEFDEGEELEPYNPQVRNGTHRVFAHYLSEHKEANVQLGWHPNGEEPNDTHDWYPLIASRINFPVTLDDDTADDLFGKCRSYKLTETIWINSDCMSSYRNTYDFYWDCGLESIDNLAPYVTLIHTKITEMTAAMGYTPVIETVILNSEEESDTFFGHNPIKP